MVFPIEIFVQIGQWLQPGSRTLLHLALASRDLHHALVPRLVECVDASGFFNLSFWPESRVLSEFSGGYRPTGVPRAWREKLAWAKNPDLSSGWEKGTFPSLESYRSSEFLSRCVNLEVLACEINCAEDWERYGLNRLLSSGAMANLTTLEICFGERYVVPSELNLQLPGLRVFKVTRSLPENLATVVLRGCPQLEEVDLDTSHGDSGPFEALPAAFVSRIKMFGALRVKVTQSMVANRLFRPRRIDFASSKRRAAAAKSH